MWALRGVVAILETNDRLPAALATRLYEAGESAMGGTWFTVTLDDGRRYGLSTGNMIDILVLPEGVVPSMVVDVTPHDEGEGLPRLDFPSDSAWCLYTRE